MTPILHNSGSYNKTREKMNQEDLNKTEKNLITLLNWYRLKRVNEFAAQCDEAQAWESIQQRIRHRKRIRMYTYWSSTAAACLLIAAFSFYTLTEYDQSLFAHRGEQKATLFVNNGESYDLLSQDKSIFNANGMQVAQNTEKELRYDTQTSIQKNAEDIEKINNSNFATEDYVDEQIANFDFIKIVQELPEVGLPNRTYFVPKTDPQSNDLYDEYMWVDEKWELIGTKQIEVDLTDYVKNTDYATTGKAGVIKLNTASYATDIDENGLLKGVSRTYEQYQNGLYNSGFISKGTLENVIAGKDLANKAYVDGIVGDINNVLDTINGEVI